MIDFKPVEEIMAHLSIRSNTLDLDHYSDKDWAGTPVYTHFEGSGIVIIEIKDEALKGVAARYADLRKRKERLDDETSDFIEAVEAVASKAWSDRTEAPESAPEVHLWRYTVLFGGGAIQAEPYDLAMGWEEDYNSRPY